MTAYEQTGCYKVSFTGDPEKPTSMDLLIQHGGKPYLISIATPAFIEGLRQHNEGLDPLVQIGENYFLMDDIPFADEACMRLSKIPFDKLQPFLIEQTDE